MHVVLPDDCVEKVAEELGVTLQDTQCTRRFTEDATHNVNKLISTAQTLQRAERSNKLLIRHLQEAASLLGTHYKGMSSSPQALSKLQLSETQNMFYRQPTEIDLYDLTHGETSECTSAPLALEVSLTSEYSKTMETLPPSLYRYLTLLCQQVVSRDSDERGEALQEIQTSRRIALVVPYLIQFVELKLRDNTLLADNTLLLLSCYTHLLQNSRIYLEPYIESLLDVCYSMCCDWTDSRETANNPTTIIQHSSDVAAVIILQYDGSRTKYYKKYTRYCSETIESDEISLSALGSLTLLSKLGPRSIEDNIIPLIYGLYNEVFDETINTTMTTHCNHGNRTSLHIERVLKLALHSLYNVIYKVLHNTKMQELVEHFNTNHSLYSTLSKPHNTNHTLYSTPSKEPAHKPPQPPATKNPDSLLTYEKILAKLGPECCSMMGPTWPQLSPPPALLTKKMTKDMRKKLKETFVRFGSIKGKMLPTERKVFLRKQSDKQIKSKQIYDLHNNFTPLAYFL